MTEPTGRWTLSTDYSDAFTTTDTDEFWRRVQGCIASEEVEHLSVTWDRARVKDGVTPYAP